MTEKYYCKPQPPNFFDSHRVAGEGNCLFHSVEGLLKHFKISNDNYREIRHKVVDYMKKLKFKKEFVVKEHGGINLFGRLICVLEKNKCTHTLILREILTELLAGEYRDYALDILQYLNGDKKDCTFDNIDILLQFYCTQMGGDVYAGIPEIITVSLLYDINIVLITVKAYKCVCSSTMNIKILDSIATFVCSNPKCGLKKDVDNVPVEDLRFSYTLFYKNPKRPDTFLYFCGDHFEWLTPKVYIDINREIGRLTYNYRHNMFVKFKSKSKKSKKSKKRRARKV